MVGLEREFEFALEGRKIWLMIKEKHGFVNQDGIVIFPSANQMLNREAAAMLPQYRDAYFLDKIVAVTNQKDVAGFIASLCHENVCCEELAAGEMEALLKYYQLVWFCTHIVVVSMEEPFGEDYFLNVSGVQLQEFIMSAIYKIRKNV